jgi:thiamine-monophosphate kinase
MSESASPPPEDTLPPGGEFGLIARFAARVGAPPSPEGPGDDAAVVTISGGRFVATTDLLAENVHFRLDWSSGYDVGRRAAAANLADVAAMGAVPTALLVSVSVPPTLGEAFLDALADGLRDECALVGARIVGGDTIRSEDRLTLSVTALGDLEGREPVLRSGAQPGDVLVLAGRVGWAAAGLAWLTGRPAGRAEPASTDPVLPFVEAHRRPVVPYAAGPRLARGGARAMCDVSDGLVADAGHLATASGVAIYLDSARLRDPALDAIRVALGVSADTPNWELTGGDDHALLAALPPGSPLLTETRFHTVGSVRAGEGVYVDGVAATAGGGWDHFDRP